MKKIVPSLTLALALMSSAATAQERTGDAALGALSGAVVLGPVGAVAGAFVGYTAGPSIAGAWGLRGSSRPRQARKHAATYPQSLSNGQTTPPPQGQANMAVAAPAPTKSASVMPAVQPLE
jgi:hypothetical protein